MHDMLTFSIQENPRRKSFYKAMSIGIQNSEANGGLDVDLELKL